MMSHLWQSDKALVQTQLFVYYPSMAYRTLKDYAVLLSLMFIIADANLIAAGDENWDEFVGTPGVGVGGAGVAQHRGDLYVFGSFRAIGDVAVTNIARWKGGVWSPVGEGIEGGGVAAVVSDGKNLYAGGTFSEAGGMPARNIAQWDGTNWFPLGEGVNGTVQRIAVSGSNVFVAGPFTEAGGVLANKVARWDGTSWSALGEGIVTVYERGIPVGAVDSLAVDGMDLIVGGRFRKAGSIGATNIARWTGSEWQAFGNGLRYHNIADYSENGAVRALATVNGAIYAGGSFLLAGDIQATNIARWSADTGWQSVGSGVDDGLTVQALALNGRVLYASGPFRSIGGVQANRIAQWDGNTWAPLGSGLGGGASSLAGAGDKLFVGGYFPTAGGKPSTNVAIWHIPHALNIRSQPGQVRLSWPATGSNFVLEAKSALNDANWSEVARDPEADSDSCVMTEPVEAQRFYRLRRR